MRGYRLTRRGKSVLTIFVMLITLTCTLNLRDVAIASDKSEYVVSKGNSYIVPFSETVIANYSKTAVVLKEANKLNEKINEPIEEFLSVNVEDIRTYDKSKIAFLTFDDGPSENVTPLILNILNDYNIKGTFFVLGNMCEKNGNLLNDIIEKGHSIGIHSYSHKLNELLKSEDDFINEIKMTENELTKHLGEEFKTRLFRFPGGSFEDYKLQYMDTLNELGYVSVDWNALTGDTEVKNPTHDMLIERLKATTKNKNNVVVLMHDSATKQITVETLPEVIEYLKSEGYEFAILK